MSEPTNLTIDENGGQQGKLKRTHEMAGLDNPLDVQGMHEAYSDEDVDSCDGSLGRPSTPGPKPGKKTRGRVKINMEFIDNKLRRYTTFSKRKSGIMKKAHELATLTGTQVMLLVASETGHVYTFATRKLQPILSSEAGKQLIQTCLNSPDPPESTVNQSTYDQQRMSAQGFEEPDLSYAPPEETKEGLMQKTYNMLVSGQNSSAQSQQQTASHSTAQEQGQMPMSLIQMNNSNSNARGQVAIHIPYHTIVSGSTQQDTRTIQLSPVEAQAVMRASASPSTQSVLAQPTLLAQPTGLVHDRLNEGHIALVSPYNTLQRPAMQQVLWTPALAQPIAVMHSPPHSEDPKGDKKG